MAFTSIVALDLSSFRSDLEFNQTVEMVEIESRDFSTRLNDYLRSKTKKQNKKIPRDFLFPVSVPIKQNSLSLIYFCFVFCIILTVSIQKYIGFYFSSNVRYKREFLNNRNKRKK